MSKNEEELIINRNALLSIKGYMNLLKEIIAIFQRISLNNKNVHIYCSNSK